MQRYCGIMAVLAFMFASSLHAQSGSVEGYVLSGADTLQYATVTTRGTSRGVTSNEHGYFILQGLDQGTYQLSASFVGFSNAFATVDVVAGRVTRVDFDLGEVETIDEVVVTGTMKPTYTMDSPVKVEAISASQLEIFLPSAGTSVMESVQMIGGVQEVVACGVCYTNSININGLPGAYTAVLMDGTPMYGNLASVYGLNGIPNTIIDRIEVVRGPTSTLYGSEAVAGVINVITKDPSDQPVLSADLMATSHRESFGNLSFAPSIGSTAGYVGVNYAYINNYDDFNNDGFGDGISLDRLSLFTKWNIARKSGKQFSIAAKYFFEDRRNGVEEFLDNRAYRDLRGSESIYGESIYTNRAEVFGTYQLNTTANLRLDYSFSHHLQDSYYGSDYYEAVQSIGYLNLLWNVNVGRHDILAGLTGRIQLYDDNTIATSTRGDDGELINIPDNQVIPGIFVQDEFRVNDELTLLPGVRLDHYSSHGLIFSPRFSAKFKPSPWTTLRANFGTGFRVVNLFAEDHAFITGQRQVEIAESLKPERSYNIAVNSSMVFAAGRGSGSVDFDAFYTYFTNKIIPDYGTPDKIIYANTNGYAISAGVGASCSYGFVFPLRITAGINLLRALEAQNTLSGIEKREIEFAPAWSGLVSATYDIRKLRTTIGYSATITGHMALPEVYDLDENGVPLHDPRPQRSRPFSIHNIQLTTRLSNQFSMYAGVQNVFDYRQEISPLVGFNDPGAPAGYSDYFDTSYAYSPIHGREFYLGLKLNLGTRD